MPTDPSYATDAPADRGLRSARTVDVRWLARRISGSRPRDVRRDLAELIEAGELEPGAQLPTVREVAAELGASLGSVAGAWSELRRDGLLVTRGRSGTTVAGSQDGRPAPPADLVAAAPDPELLPDLGGALATASLHGRTGGTATIVPELRRSAQLRWSYRPPALMATLGVRSALHLILTGLLTQGVPIATVDPLCLRTADVLRRFGAPIIPVAEDEHGPVTESLADAVRHGAGLFCFEPTLSVPNGAVLTPQRRDELAAVLRRAPEHVRVFEEEPAGAMVDGISLGSELPDRVLHVVPYSRAFGADLAVAVLSGPSTEIAALARLQAAQGAQVGVLAQRLLARLLVDRPAASGTRSAAKVYARRNLTLKTALREAGLDVQGAGFYLWVGVTDETSAVEALASRGIRVTAGRRSRIAPSRQAAIRIATTSVPEDTTALAELAAAIAAAAGTL